MNKEKNKEKLSEIAYTLKAIANEIRLSVILNLQNSDEMNVSQLVKNIGCEQSLLSHHLTDMRAKGILKCRKEGKKCYYSLSSNHFLQIIDCIEKCKDCT